MGMGLSYRITKYLNREARKERKERKDLKVYFASLAGFAVEKVFELSYLIIESCPRG